MCVAEKNKEARAGGKKILSPHVSMPDFYSDSTSTCPPTLVACIMLRDRDPRETTLQFAKEGPRRSPLRLNCQIMPVYWINQTARLSHAKNKTPGNPQKEKRNISRSVSKAKIEERTKMKKAAQNCKERARS